MSRVSSRQLDVYQHQAIQQIELLATANESLRRQLAIADRNAAKYRNRIHELGMQIANLSKVLGERRRKVHEFRQEAEFEARVALAIMSTFEKAFKVHGMPFPASKLLRSAQEVAEWEMDK